MQRKFDFRRGSIRGEAEQEREKQRRKLDLVTEALRRRAQSLSQFIEP